MEGIITIKDTKENLEKLKQWQKDKIKQITNNPEKSIDKAVDVTKSVVTFAGTTATVVLAVCPLDGPVGEIATMLATPALVKAVESSRDVLKSIFVTKDRNQITASIADLKGNIKDISVIDKNMVQTEEELNMQGKTL